MTEGTTIFSSTPLREIGRILEPSAHFGAFYCVSRTLCAFWRILVGGFEKSVVLAAQTHFDPRFLKNPGPPKTAVFQTGNGQLGRFFDFGGPSLF